MADINNIVNVTITPVPAFLQGKGFGIINIVGMSASLPIGDRIRHYSDLLSVGRDFSSTSEEFKAAQVFFAQSPRPNDLVISRRLVAPVAAELLGGLGVTQNIADFQAVTGGAFAIPIDGVVKQVSAVNLQAAANLNAVAAIVQAALQVAAPAATCVWTGTRFKVSSGSTGTMSTIGFAAAPTAGTDISHLMGLDLSSGGKVTNGAVAETVADALINLLAIDSSWYGVTLTADSDAADQEAAAAWTAGNSRFFGFTTQDASDADPSGSGGLGRAIKATTNGRAFGQWSNLDTYGHISAMARLFSTDFSQTNSVITLKFKQLPGVSVVNITDTQRKALEANNLNYYTLFGTSPMLAEGVMMDGTFADQVHALDFLANAMQTNVFGFLLAQPRVAQTDKGVSQVVQRVDVTWGQVANAGLIAPGVYNGDGFGTIKTGDFLAKGFYSFAAPVASQPESDRQARKAPPITTVGLGAGAIHGVTIAVTFQP